MIWNGLVSVAVAVAGFFVSLFPNVDANIVNIITGGLAGFKSLIASIDWFFPANNLLEILGYILAIELAMFLIKASRWVINAIIPFVKV